MGELETIFVETGTESRHPVIEGDGGDISKLFIEGTHCLDIHGNTSEQLLLWGVCFSVFGQRLSFLVVKNTATFLAVYILKSDAVTKLPKVLAAQIGKLLPRASKRRPRSVPATPDLKCGRERRMITK